MQARAQLDLRPAFVLRSAHIQRIWIVLNEAIGAVRATASYADHIERQFDEPDALLNYENSRARAIKSIYFRARSNNHDASARVTLKNESYSTVSLDVEGEESMVAKVRDNLTEVFDGMRAWYAPVCRLDFYFVATGVIALAYVVLQGMSGGETTRQPLTFLQAVWFTLVIVGFIAAMAVVVWLLNRLRTRFFPLASYAIGQGLERYELDDKSRWAVIVGFGVSVIASIVAALLLPTS